MGAHFRTASFLFAVLLLAGGSALAQEQGLPVKEIEFRGVETARAGSLGELIRTKVGERFSDEKIQADVSNLRAFFEEVVVQVEPVPGGLKVVFVVTDPNPVVTSMILRGFSEVPPEDARKEIWTKEGVPFAEFKVERDAALLRERLVDEGYLHAEVKVAVGEYAGGKQVVFTAIEGPRVDVEEIRFVGNAAFDEDRLEDEMLLREDGLFTDGPYVERTLRQDLVSLAWFHRREGYLDVVVELREVSFSPDAEKAFVTIGITEGEPYRVESFTIEGGDEFPADRSELQALVHVEEGAILRQEDVFLTEQAVRNFYLSHAYFDVRVGVEQKHDATRHASALILRIEAGSTARIRRIDVTGNSLTREDVIRRYLTIHPGGPLNSIEIEKSKSRLLGTNFFLPPDGVDARVLDTDEPGVKDVVFQVEEGSTGSIRLSAGYGTDRGVMGLIELEKRNFDYADFPERFSDVFEGRAFTGGGQRLNLQLSPGSVFSQYRLGFQEPWFLDEYLFYGPSGEFEESPFSFGFDVYLNEEEAFDYDEERLGFSLSTGKAWRRPARIYDDVIRSRISFRLENVRIDDLGDEAPPNAYVLEGLNRVHRLSFSLGWDHLDLPASPGSGFAADLSYELGGGFLGGEIDYHKVEAAWKQFFTLYTDRDEDRHILEVTARVGYAVPFGDTDDVPLFDRFKLGGQSTIRGFPYGEVGPRAEGNPFTEEGRERIAESIAKGDGDPVGGESMWLVKAEYSFPLIEDRLRGVVFVDAGNVSEGHFDDDLFSKWRASTGFGIRLLIPEVFGPIPIALDFGWPIRRERGDDQQIISISISRPF